MSAAYLQAFVGDFLKTYQALIRPELADESKNQLYDIAVGFGDLAIRLLSLKSVISCHGIEHFQSLAFEVDSAEMTFASSVPLEEHDPSLNGRPIPLVVQPLIMGHGTADGKNYDRKKIWSKAVVWVSSKPDPAKTGETEECGTRREAGGACEHKTREDAEELKAVVEQPSSAPTH